MADRLEFKHKKVQRVRKLLRKREQRLVEGVFVIEGYKLLEEAQKASVDIESVYVAPGAQSPVIDQVAASGVRVFALGDGVIERIADTVSPQPVLAVVRMPANGEWVSDSATAVLVLADVRDPGNAGTIIRSAEAAGISALVFCGGSVDPFNPKTVRSTAGALFHLPIFRADSVTDSVRKLHSQGFLLFGTAGDGETPYDEADLTRRVAIVLGNEASGMEALVRGEMDEVLVIPIDGQSESLNVSMAAAVLSFELARQRRQINSR